MDRIEASQFRTQLHAAFSTVAGVLLAAITMVLPIRASTAQELVLAPEHTVGSNPYSAPVVVFPDFGGGLPNPPRSYVLPLDYPPLDAHGLALVAADRALSGQVSTQSVNLLDTANATRIESYPLPQPSPSPSTWYDGLGTLAANPARTHVLAVSKLDTLWVIPAPFDSTAVVTMLTLPSGTATPQTRAIAFDSTTGRAYVAVRTGIVVVDPPYTSVAFTIPGSNGVVGGQVGAIALSPDNATLVVTTGTATGYTPDLRIFHAPFSVASVPEVLTIPGSNLNGMTFTPDGSKVIVVEFAKFSAPPGSPRVYAVTGPFSAASTVETLLIAALGVNHSGFEDIDISADGQLAALSGGSSFEPDPLVVLKAPFTAAGFSATLIDIPQFGYPYSGVPGRGAGTARFWSTAIPASPPQVFVDFSATYFGISVMEGNSGTTDALVPVNLSAPSAQTVTVDYTTVDGTAPGGATAANNDYIPASGTLSFAPGETTKNIVIKVNGDTKYEADERYKLVISNPVNATLLNPLPSFANTGTIIIVNDDAAVPVAITTVALPNGVAGTPYSFQLTGTGADPLTWPSTNSSFNPSPFGLTIDPATGIISGIPTNPGSYTVFINLTDGVGNTDFKSLPITVTGVGQPVVDLSPNPLDFGSRAVGSTSAKLQVVVANDGFGPLVLGSPVVTIPPGSDFALASGAQPCTAGLTVPQANTCSLYFTFTPQVAGTRSLTVNVAHNAPATSLTLTGIGTGGGALPVVSIANAVAVAEGNVGTTPMTFAVTLTPASAGTVTVNYAANGGTATNGVDYTVAGTGTLTFAPGVTTQNITVNVNGDTQVESNETIVMTLSTPSGATLGTATASGTILNDDGAAPVLALITAAPGFGNQVLATASATRQVTIGNTGGGNLVLATPFAVLAAGDFSYDTGQNSCHAGESLAPTAVCNLYIVFTPSALGPRTMSIVLSSNAPDVTMVLTGVGITAAAPSTSQPIPTLSQWALALLALLMIAIVLVRQRAQRGGMWP